MIHLGRKLMFSLAIFVPKHALCAEKRRQKLERVYRRIDPTEAPCVHGRLKPAFHRCGGRLRNSLDAVSQGPSACWPVVFDGRCFHEQDEKVHEQFGATQLGQDVPFSRRPLPLCENPVCLEDTGEGRSRLESMGLRESFFKEPALSSARRLRAHTIHASTFTPT